MQILGNCISDNIVITYLSPKIATDLRQHAYLQNNKVLDQNFTNRILISAKMLPSATRLVAYDNERKTAAGFLCLEKNTSNISSLKYVFVHPEYRGRGIAKSLLTYVISYAKENGVKKINLNVYPTTTNAIELYKKVGFKEIGKTSLIQGSVYTNNSRFIRRILVGQGFLTTFASGTDSDLLKYRNTEKNTKKAFEIYEKCVEEKWTKFFEKNYNNLINGSRHIWQPSFFKDMLIDRKNESLALVYNRPFAGTATAELYISNKNIVETTLDNLLQVLTKRGFGFTQISLINCDDSVKLKQIEKNCMRDFQFIAMGIIL
jgi:GNAT superfamily N-acetyltransferase